MKTKYLLYISLFLSGCTSCRKEVNSPDHVASPIELSLYQWRLISVTHSNQSLVTYNGSSSDSLRFTWKWLYNGDVEMDSVFCYYKGNTNSFAGNFLIGGAYVAGKPVLIDTVVCSQPWRQGYTNRLVMSDIINNVLVFHVQSSNGSDVETDSLKAY